MRSWPSSVATVALVLWSAPGLSAHAGRAAAGAEELVVGHWVEVKGELEGDKFVASGLDVLEPEDEEALIGTVVEVNADAAWINVLGQRIEFSDKTEWRKIEVDELAGARVKVEGYYRSPRKFSSRTIALRPPGRDRIVGRIDELTAKKSGELRLRVMRFDVVVPPDLELDHEKPLAKYTLAPERVRLGSDTQEVRERERDDDDDLGGSLVIAENLRLGLRVEWQGRQEQDYNLNETDEEDRTDHNLSLRGELVWTPWERFYALFGFRQQLLLRNDDDDGYIERRDSRLNEAYGYLRDVGTPGFDLQVGRQDFDEDREWIYDENLDAVRLHYVRPGWRLELSASTVLSDASPDDKATDNFIAYLSNNDEDRTLAAYVVDRRNDRGVDNYPIHFGVRALGEWLPDNDVWVELATVRGYMGNTDLEGYAFDVGTTWYPELLEPAYFTAGYAFGSGDGDVDDGDDGNFRQTGLHDNNGKWGGVTSFRYYGELVDPQLSNMGILSLGIGTRIGRKRSLDLAYHRYEQDVATTVRLDSEIDARPNGLSRDLGWELDLIYGSRARDWLAVEVVLAAFGPGAAFDKEDTAYFAKLQLRFSF